MRDSKISELEPKSHGQNLIVRVESIKATEEKKRYDGAVIKIAEVLIGDDSGCVVLTARNGTSSSTLFFPQLNQQRIEQIDQFVVGNVYVLRNCTVDMHQGFMRISVTQWGKISTHPDGIASTPDAPKKVKTDSNMSEVEYELVDAA